MFVPVLTVPQHAAGECHQNVERKIARDGGSVQYGWVIWEIPPWAIQAEFHSVWRAPDGELLDVTPALHGGSRVLFLPDPTRVFEGRNVPGVHRPYSDSPMCDEFVEIIREQERLLYPPGEPHTSEKRVSRDALAAIMSRMMKLFARYG